MDGNAVASLWLDGRLDEIITYNEFDAITTYLLWLRVALFGGFVSPPDYEAEQLLLKEYLKEESAKPERKHLIKYLEEWDRVSVTPDFSPK